MQAHLISASQSFSIVEQVKALRSITGYGLKASKDIIDGLLANPPIQVTIHFSDHAQLDPLRSFGVIVEVDEPNQGQSQSFLREKQCALDAVRKFAVQLLENNRFDDATTVCNQLSILDRVNLEEISVGNKADTPA